MNEIKKKLWHPQVYVNEHPRLETARAHFSRWLVSNRGSSPRILHKMHGRMAPWGFLLDRTGMALDTRYVDASGPYECCMFHVLVWWVQGQRVYTQESLFSHPRL